MAVNRKIAIPLIALAVALCGIWLQARGKHSADETQASRKQSYICSMHPFIVKDGAGICPICNMELIKNLEPDAGAGDHAHDHRRQAGAPGRLSITAAQRVIADVATLAVRKRPLTREITAVGIVQYDQSLQGKVTAWIDGRLDTLHVDKVGDSVTTEQPVAEIYSPTLVASQEEYLLALKGGEKLKSSPLASISRNGEGLARSSKERLLLFGVSEQQIAELEKTGLPLVRLPIYTPISGIVIEKLVQLGQYVKTGDVLFNVADLSRLWVELEVYENEFADIRCGQRVEIKSGSYPGRLFAGAVSYIYPFLDPKTRTVKVRVEMPNHDRKLKPDMFVNGVVKAPLGMSIVVPVTAVMDTGKRKVVWAEVSPGTFEPRSVQTGHRTRDGIQILSGLKQGEQIAVSGGYLIDSESQLRGDDGHEHGSPPGHEGGKGKHGSHAGTPAKQAPKGSLDMDDMKM